MSIDAHVSRSYQEELAQRAREGNAILAMDTGTGKTMIAAMVIKERLRQESMNRGSDRSPSTKKVSSHKIMVSPRSNNWLGCDLSRPKGASCGSTTFVPLKEHGLCHPRIYWSNGG